MRVQFLRSVHGERYGYAEGAEVSVGDGHSITEIPTEWAEQLLKDGAVKEIEDESAEPEKRKKKGAS